MYDLKPEVRLIAATFPDWNQISDHVYGVGGGEWVERIEDDGREHGPETLVEFGGRLCYRSWAPGLNPNVTKVRENSPEYLQNIVHSGHGSVLEHISFSFIFSNVSRVFTHELVRHRAGTAFSQESMRYVRLDQIPFRLPDWIVADDVLNEAAVSLLKQMEAFQALAAERAGIDDFGKPFAYKKEVTSDMRRFAPEGVLTSIHFTCNLRELRHIISMRTSPHAEKELREVFGQVAELVRGQVPALMADFTVNEDGSWTTDFRA